MLTDPSLFADVADALGIKNPVIVEGDVFHHHQSSSITYRIAKSKA